LKLVVAELDSVGSNARVRGALMGRVSAMGVGAVEEADALGVVALATSVTATVGE
jgi:hypothetical protein